MKPRSIMMGNRKLYTPFISQNYLNKTYFLLFHKADLFPSDYPEILWGTSHTHTNAQRGFILFWLFNLRTTRFFLFLFVPNENCCYEFSHIFSHSFMHVRSSENYFQSLLMQVNVFVCGWNGMEKWKTSHRLLVLIN